jgi:hypothetical protein
VWNVLSNFAYDEWNPYVKIEGTAQVGIKVTGHMGATRGRGMTFKPTVLAARPDDELRWLGKLGSARIVDGEHFFILDRNPARPHPPDPRRNYSDALVALMKPFLHKARNQAGYEGFNQVLKKRVESIRDA